MTAQLGDGPWGHGLGPRDTLQPSTQRQGAEARALLVTPRPQARASTPHPTLRLGLAVPPEALVMLGPDSPGGEGVMQILLASRPQSRNLGPFPAGSQQPLIGGWGLGPG